MAAASDSPSALAAMGGIRFASLMVAMFARDTRFIYHLFLLNVCLQVFDGVATYYVVGSPAGEGNPLIAASMAHVGVGTALLLYKAKACGCLLVLRRLGARSTVGVALAATAVVYGTLSFLPWMTRILHML